MKTEPLEALPLLLSNVAPSLCCSVVARSTAPLPPPPRRLDADAILGSSDAAALAVAVTALVQVGETAEREGGDPPVLDPVADLKLNSIGGWGTARRDPR